MSNYRSGYLEQGAPVGAVRKDVLLSADNQIVDLDDCSLLYLQSNNTTASNRTFTLKSGVLFGQTVSIMFESGSSYTCELAASGNMKLSAAWTPLQWDVLQVQWDGTYWVEIGRGYTGSGGPNFVANDSIVNADINTAAAIAYSKLAALTDANILVGSAANVATVTPVTGDITITNAGVTAIGAGKVLESMLGVTTGSGLFVKRYAKGVYNLAAGFTAGAHTIGATVPTNSFVTGAWYWVKTTFTSATDAATIAISLQGANDITSAIAISDGTNPWDLTALPVEGIPKLETTSSWLKTTAARALTVTTATETITAGEMYVWLEYITIE